MFWASLARLSTDWRVLMRYWNGIGIRLMFPTQYLSHPCLTQELNTILPSAVKCIWFSCNYKWKAKYRFYQALAKDNLEPSLPAGYFLHFSCLSLTNLHSIIELSSLIFACLFATLPAWGSTLWHQMQDTLLNCGVMRSVPLGSYGGPHHYPAA